MNPYSTRQLHDTHVDVLTVYHGSLYAVVENLVAVTVGIAAIADDFFHRWEGFCTFPADSIQSVN